MLQFRWKRLSDKDWVQAKPGRLKYAAYALARLAYRAIPIALSTQFTIGGALVWLTRLGLLALIAFVPVIFPLFVAPLFGAAKPADTSLSANGGYQALLLGTLLATKLVLDRLTARRVARQDRLRSLANISTALSATLNVLQDQIGQFAKTGKSKAQIDGVLQYTLLCIESVVRIYSERGDERYCSVSLLTIEPNGKVKIRARSNLERPVGKVISQRETYAFLAAQYARETFVIHNFRWAKWFHKQRGISTQGLSSPTTPPYRSILILPLPAVTIAGGNQIRKGAVTIDTARPFEFLGRDLAILARVHAFLELINLMLTNHNTGVVPEL
jgi:hypothetical protein